MQYKTMTVKSNLSLELKQNLSSIIYKARQSCTGLVKSVSVGFTSVKEEHAKPHWRGYS